MLQGMLSRLYPWLENPRAEKLILQGRFDEPVDQDPLQRLVFEASLQIAGKFSDILRSTEGLAPAPLDEQERRLWCERKFLRGFGYQRTGQGSEARREWAELLAHAGGLAPLFDPRIRVEEGVSRLNQGDFLSSVQILRGALTIGRDNFDLYTLTRVLGCLGLANIHLGEFNRAEAYLDEEARALSSLEAPALQAGLTRIRITLALKRDDFDRSQSLLNEALPQAEESRTTYAYLLQLQARVYLARNFLDEARTTLERLKRWAERFSIPASALDPSEEWLELHLRLRELPMARTLVARALAQAEARHDRFAGFRLRVAEARSQALAGRREQALRIIEQAVVEGEDRGYRPDLVAALFHAAGIAFQARDLLRFRNHSLRGQRLAGELDLSLRHASFTYLLEFHRKDASPSSAFLALLRAGRSIGRELEYSLNTYSILSKVRLEIFDGQKRFRMEESVFRSELFSESGVFWFPAERTLLAKRSGRLDVISFEEGSLVLAAFLLALNRAEGFTLEDVHRLRSKAPFHPFRHTAAARMILTRLRQEAERVGLGVDYHRESGRYRLESFLTPLTIEVQRETASPDAAPAAGGGADRERQIFERIREERFARTADLCDRLGMTRQSLHPYLKELTRRGLVKLVRRGPVSGYALVT
jgi:hypothetical protein